MNRAPKVFTHFLIVTLLVTAFFVFYYTPTLNHNSYNKEIKGVNSLYQTYVSTASFGGTTSSDAAWGTTMLADNSSNQYVIGGYSGTIDLDSTSGTAIHTASVTTNYIAKYNSTGGFLWGYDLPTDGFQTFALSNDRQEMTLVLMCNAQSGNSIDFDPTSGSDMKTCRTALFITLGFDGTYKRSATFEQINSSFWPVDAKYDSAGNFYLVGSFQAISPFDFDFSAGTDNKTTGYTFSQFLLKLNADNSYGWTKQIYNWQGSVTYLANMGDLIIDHNNNMYYTGFISGTVDLDIGSGTNSYTVPDYIQYPYVTKLDATGGYLWSRVFAAQTPNQYSLNFYVRDLQVDSANNILMSGDLMAGTIVDSGTNAIIDIIPAADSTVGVIKLNPSNSFIWAKRFAADGSNMVIDSADDIFVYGYWSGTANFDPDGDYTLIDNSTWENSVYINALDSNGTRLWTYVTTGGDETDAYGAAIVNNTLYFVGDVYGTANFDPGRSNDMISGDPCDGKVTLTTMTLALYQPSASPSVSPDPTIAPSESPSPSPSESPIPTDTSAPTVSPSPSSSPSPSASPSISPSVTTHPTVTVSVTPPRTTTSATPSPSPSPTNASSFINVDTPLAADSDAPSLTATTPPKAQTTSSISLVWLLTCSLVGIFFLFLLFFYKRQQK